MAIKTPVGFEEPDTPPPTYSAAAGSSTTGYTDLERAEVAQPKDAQQVQAAARYGPTPLVTAGHQNQSLPMPVYDPNSAYSIGLAKSRARWRFISGLFWAFLIWMALGMLIGGIESDIHRVRRGHKH
ncbi:hypothetical protein FRB94_007531 [Tulasnella sp. JGI-2019a]|nr:hypothetical protein FRB94_007531 [Tulasnella sp. JGI-2019a]KAG9016079.1 hypothetical protein FRB93_011553 [Tulasnella sp. JGI-2019a]KAG9028891.1 hypothetical protein FRB95_005941 [Tulasnella sp. JGI-2019a]